MTEEFQTEQDVCRAFPMVSSLIGPQYHDDQFWKFSVSASQGSPNNFDTPVVPAFATDFEVSDKD